MTAPDSTTFDALTICNGCDLRPMVAGDPRGYCQVCLDQGGADYATDPDERRFRATLVAAIRFADTTVRYATSARRRVEAAEVLERNLATYTERYGPIVGPIENLWSVR